MHVRDRDTEAQTKLQNKSVEMMQVESCWFFFFSVDQFSRLFLCTTLEIVH